MGREWGTLVGRCTPLIEGVSASEWSDSLHSDVNAGPTPPTRPNSWAPEVE